LHDLDERQHYTLVLPTLKELTLAFLSVDGLPRFELANLKQLTLKEGILDDIDFDQLSEDLPMLETLIIDALPGEHALEWWVADGRSPIFASLRTLEVRSALLIDEDSNLLQLVRYIPNIENLSFRFSGSTLTLLDNLHACYLKNLTVDLCQDEEYDSTIFDAALLRASLARAPNLESFTLCWSDPHDQRVETFFSPFLHALSPPLACPLLKSLTFIQCNFEMDDLLALPDSYVITLEKCFGLPDVKNVGDEELRKALFGVGPMNLPFATYECGCGCDHGSDSEYCGLSDGEIHW
jgi:hypothetical protein